MFIAFYSILRLRIEFRVLRSSITAHNAKFYISHVSRFCLPNTKRLAFQTKSYWQRTFRVWIPIAVLNYIISDILWLQFKPITLVHLICSEIKTVLSLSTIVRIYCSNTKFWWWSPAPKNIIDWPQSSIFDWNYFEFYIPLSSHKKFNLTFSWKYFCSTTFF